MRDRRRPGQVRDAIVSYLRQRPQGAAVAEITEAVASEHGGVPDSSVRSYLRLNTPEVFERVERGRYRLQAEEQLALPIVGKAPSRFESFTVGKARMVLGDCLQWLAQQPPNSIHAVVTDPPYGLVEYSDTEQAKLRNGKGGVWRIPPSFDGHRRSPLPRFTVLTDSDLRNLAAFFTNWTRVLLPVLVPGALVVVASNPLVSHIVSGALADGGLERRGEIIRLVMTMRGGDRPKNAHEEFPGVSVMPRSMWEPWVVFRRPLEGRVQDNLRKWRTGGFRRPSRHRPFGDVISSGPTRKAERQIAPHPSLKPQAFLRQVVRGVLPFGEGIVLDPFAGSGSTLAAAEAVGYTSVGVESDREYFEVAKRAVLHLAQLSAPSENQSL